MNDLEAHYTNNEQNRLFLIKVLVNISIVFTVIKANNISKGVGTIGMVQWYTFLKLLMLSENINKRKQIQIKAKPGLYISIIR